jgi:hypothetical protein
MKLRFAFSFFLIISFYASAQVPASTTQPTAVTAAQPTTAKLLPHLVSLAFHSKYQAAQNVSWAKEDTIYKAKFVLNAINMSVAYSPSGKVLATASQIFAKQLPAGVLTYLQQNDPGAKLTEISSLTDGLGNIYYQVGANGLIFMFDSKGDFIKSGSM